MPARLTDPLRNFRFHVNITGGPSGSSLLQAGFQAVSGLSVGVPQPFVYQEGGNNASPIVLPGPGQFSPIQCTRGLIMGHGEAWAWMADVLTGTGKLFADSCVVEVARHPGTNWEPRLRFTVYNAWISQLDYSDLVATPSGDGGGAVMTERMTLQSAGWNLTFL